jgi:predicted nucleic acid-binding protein
VSSLTQTSWFPRTWGGALEPVIVAWKTGKFTLIVSDQIASEYFSILKRPKFQIELDELEDFAALILSNAEFVLPEEHVLVIQADS